MKRFSLTHPALSVPAEYRSGFTHLYFDIAWFGLVSGSTLAFIAIYATHLGASAFQIGLLTAGPAIVNLMFTMPAGRWVEKRPVSSAVFWSAIFNRIFYLLFVFLPIALLPHGQIWMIVGFTLLMGIPATALLIGFNSLFAEAVPPEWRGHVAGIRNALFSLTTITTTLISGEILIRVPFPTNYQIVFGLGFLGAAMSTLHLRLVLPPPCHGEKAAAHLERTWAGTLHNLSGTFRSLRQVSGARLLRTDVLTGPFGRLMALLFAFHLAQFLPMPLFPLYQVHQLHLSDQEISLGTALFNGLVLLGSLQLATLTKRLGNQRLTGIGIIVLSGYPLLMGMSRGLELFLVASVVGGTGWSMVGGALNNYILEGVPADDRPAYLAWYNLALNAAILLGSLAGPLMAGWIGLAGALILGGICRLFAAAAILRWGS
jgi:MFS family permease